MFAPIDAWTRGLPKWTTSPRSVKRLTSAISGMFVHPSFLSVAPIFLSSLDAVLWTVFFLRRAVPLPPDEEV